MTINTNNLRAMASSNIIAPISVARKLGWTASSSQPVIPMPKSNAMLYSNRVVIERNGKYYIKTRSKVELEVVKLSENKYEVVVGV